MSLTELTLRINKITKESNELLDGLRRLVAQLAALASQYVCEPAPPTTRAAADHAAIQQLLDERMQILEARLAEKYFGKVDDGPKSDDGGDESNESVHDV